MKLSFQAQLVGVQSKVDKTVKVTLDTQEMGRDAGELMNISGEQVAVVLATADEPEIVEEDVPEVVNDEDLGGKSPSQRLRNVLYVRWEQKGKPGDNFEMWRRARMERIIEHEKQFLD